MKKLLLIIVLVSVTAVTVVGLLVGLFSAQPSNKTNITQEEEMMDQQNSKAEQVTEALTSSASATIEATATPTPKDALTATPTPVVSFFGSEEIDATSSKFMSAMEISLLCPTTANSVNPDVTYGTVVHHTYQSKTTGLERGVNVLVPAGYDANKKYPVLYLLHGIFGNEYSFTNDPNMQIETITGNMIASGETEDMIVVFPDMFAKTRADHEPGFNFESYFAYDNFINDLVNDLIPFMEANYSVMTDREHRAIAGFSMGGRESLFIMVTRPDLFAYCTAFAPAPGLTPGKDFGGEHPGQLQEAELRIKDMQYMPKILMVDCGNHDSVVGKFPLSYHNIMLDNQVNHIWYEVPDADHDSKTIQSGYYNFLRYVFK